MALSIKDLEKLAAYYGVSARQLDAPPDQADLVERLDEVQGIIEGLEPDAREHWLAIGRAMRQAGAKKAS